MQVSKSSSVQVRPANAKDVGKLCEFDQELLHKWGANATARDSQVVYDHILQSADLGVILVAEHAEGICGFAYVSFEWRSEFGGETMDLVEMFVEHSWRNSGVGRTLLNALIAVAKKRNIRRFSCQVHPGNAAIEHALDSCGFDPERRTVWGLHI